MKKIVVGPQAKLLLLHLAQYEGDEVTGRMTAEEWEASCTIMGLQVAFRGDLPPAVALECRATMEEVALRSGLPLHIYPAGQGPETLN